MKKYISKKYVPGGTLPTRFIHPDSFLSRQSPYPDYTIKDAYQRTRDYYLRRRAYERGLESLNNDMWIPIDQICQVRGTQRWQVYRNIENGTEQDPTLVLVHLARQSIYSFLIRFQFETDMLLLHIDENFPPEARVKQVDYQAHSGYLQYSLPVPATEKIKARIQAIKNHPDSLTIDRPNGQSEIRVILSENQSNWIDPIKRLNLIIYEEVYISGFAQIQALISANKNQRNDWPRLA